MSDIGSSTEGSSRVKRAREDSFESDSSISSEKLDSTITWTVESIEACFSTFPEHEILYPDDLQVECIGDKEISRYRDYMGKRIRRMTKNELTQNFCINKMQYEELNKNKKLNPNYNGTGADDAEAILKTTFSDEQLFGINEELLNKAKKRFMEFFGMKKEDKNKIKYILSLSLMDFYDKLEETYIRSKSELERINGNKSMSSSELNYIEAEYTHINGSKKSTLTLLNSRVDTEKEMIELMNEADRNDSYQCILPTLRAMTGNKKDEKVIDDYVKSILGIFSYNKNNSINIGSLNLRIKINNVSLSSQVDVSLFKENVTNYCIAVKNKTDIQYNIKNAEAQIIGEMFSVYMSQFTVDNKINLDRLKEKTVYGIVFIGLRPTFYKATFDSKTAELIIKNHKKYQNYEEITEKVSNVVSKLVLFKGIENLITSPGA
ncbi:hypothetical protein AX774_g6603, partial [Zancudomyces culisetae]